MRAKTRILVSILALGLSASSVHAKGEVVSAPEPSAKAILADIPFEQSEESHRIFVNLAKEGSRPLVMLLDTGAQYSVMTPGTARSLGVSVRATKSSPYRRGTRLGRDLQFWVDTSASDTGARGFEYGLLGGNFLEQYVVELDFPRERVRFLDPKRYRLPKSVSAENEAIVRIQLAASRPMVTVQRGKKKISALLDTGAPPALLLSGSAAEKLAIDPSQLSTGATIYTVLGPTDALSTTSDDIEIAGIESTRMPVWVAPKGLYNQAGNTDSIVGFDWMKQFTVRIDYRRSKMWLRREPGAPEWRGWGDGEKAAPESDAPEEDASAADPPR
jgi:predicted aspartyl protease